MEKCKNSISMAALLVVLILCTAWPYLNPMDIIDENPCPISIRPWVRNDTALIFVIPWILAAQYLHWVFLPILQDFIYSTTSKRRVLPILTTFLILICILFFVVVGEIFRFPNLPEWLDCYAITTTPLPFLIVFLGPLMLLILQGLAFKNWRGNCLKEKLAIAAALTLSTLVLGGLLSGGEYMVILASQG